MSIKRSEKPEGTRRFQRRARQEADKQALQARILETARTEFARGTLETVSIQKIADALGYSKGTVLKYFPTKILLLLAVKQTNLQEVTDRLKRVRARNPNSEIRLRRVMEAYVDYWLANPDHYRSVFSMAGTVEDRRYPNGVYFGDTEVARGGVQIFVTSVEEFLADQGVDASPMLSQRLATAILSAAHGVISLPLGTPTMKWPDIRGNGRLVFGNLIDAWSAKIEAARRTEAWPKLSLSHFL
jgi:AcrR family transcriptional regulator